MLRKIIPVQFFLGKTLTLLVFLSAISLTFPHLAEAAVPTASNQSLSLTMGAERLIALSYADSDTPAANMTFTILNAPARGTLQSYNERNGTTDFPQYYYYKADGGYTGSASFTWKCNDGTSDSNTATVSVTINANTAPTANNQTAKVVTNSVRFGVYLNFSDQDQGQTFTFTLLTPPTNGTLEWYDSCGFEGVGGGGEGSWEGVSVGTPVSSGSWYYTPAVGYMGADSFTWKVNDGIADSNVATVSVSVIANTAPTASNQSLSLISGTQRRSLWLSYTDPDAGQNRTFTLTAGPAHGTLAYWNEDYESVPLGTAVSSNLWYYTPAVGHTGADSFSWKCNDGVDDSNVATYSFTITANAVPVANDQKAVMIKNQATTLAASFTDPDAGQTRTLIVITPPAHGTLTTSGTNFTYTPTTNYTGTDSFSWKINDGAADSNVATCRLLVRAENSRGGMVVLLVVKDTLLTEINAEVTRLKTDLDNEGYTGKIKSWTGNDATALWNYLVSEYNTPGQFVSGAILIGTLPTATNSSNNQTTDCAFMNMETYRDTTKRQIWVSRVWGNVSYSTGEATMIKRYLQQNHDCRTGARRVPENVWWACVAYPDSTSYFFPNNGACALEVWPTATVTNMGGAMNEANRAGGELMNEEGHGAPEAYGNYVVSRASAMNSLVQIPYSFICSCSSGALGGVVNQQLFTRGGANMFSVGATTTAYSGDYIILNSGNAAFRARLAAGDSWGNSIVRGYPISDRYRAIFYGDLSLPVKVNPANQIPTISAFTVDKTSGNAPLTVNFAVTATDADGSVANYEWFTDAHWYGTQNPNFSGAAASNVSRTYTVPHRYLARVEVVDNYGARAWQEKEIAVGPTPGQPVRVNCGNVSTSTWNNVYAVKCFQPGKDYTDGSGNLWLHDQEFLTGTWGVSGGADAYNSSVVGNTTEAVLFQNFRQCPDNRYPGFTYKVPVTNGGYWLKLGFADMQSTAAGQRIMDVEVEGMNFISGLDVFAQVGGKKAMTLTFYVDVADGELLFTIRNGGGKESGAFLNCFEVLPYAGGNRPPLAQSQSVSTPHDTAKALTLTATDPDGDSLTYIVVAGPTSGTLSGAAPNLTYTPAAGYIGPDSFTFKTNDGACDGNTGTISITVGGLIAHWKLDETSGTTATDATGNGYNGTLQNTAAWTTAGKINGALSLTAANDMFLCSAAKVPLGAEWTICGWFTAPLPATNTWHTLTRSQSNDHHIITNNSLILGMYDNATGGGFRSCGFNMGGLAAGWHHVAGVGSGTTTKFYIDGVYVGTSDRKAASSDVYAVGNYQSGGQRFAERIDDMRVYNYALSAQEIAALVGANMPPVAVISATPTSGATPLAVSFSGTGSSDADGTIVSYAWNFGDGQTASGATVGHTYNAIGTFTATLTVTDNHRATGSSSIVITAISSNTPPVIDSPPTATPNPATVGQTVSFSVAASDADGDALTYAWTFGDGQSGSGAMPTHVYNVAGTYTATVTVSDGKGGTASGSVTVTVNPPANQAPTVATAAKATPSPATGTTTALSVLGADDGGEANLTYTWATTGTPPAAVAFSPNGTNAAKNSTATFTKAGSYSFQVTIKDAGNLTVTSSVNVTVNQTLTTISVAPTSASVNTGATQQFTATAKDQFGANLTTQPTFSWTASGGGTISSAGLFTAGSTAGGPYTVTASSGGKSGTASVTVTAVATAPTITTQPANQTVTVGQTASFSVVVSGTAPLSYQWYKNNTAIGDATAASYTTSATTTGDHGAKFKVTVSNSAGNLTSNEATLTVNPATAAGRILIACDNGYELYVNGAYVGSGTNWMQMQTYALNFVVGGNVVAVKGLDAGGVAALLAEVQCGTMRLGTSTTWKVSLTGASGWETAGFDDSAWVAAKDYGAYGVGPWGTRVGGCPADTAARWIWTNNNNANDVIFARFSFDLSGTVTVPTITTQPVNVTVTVGQTATFSAAASGTAPLSYQWFKNNTVIDGATAASYTTPATTLADNDAKFKVVATNSAGNATSVEATLTVNAAASQILISCDNGYTLYFNGQQVGAANNWFQMQSYTVKPQLGRNVVAVKCTDAGGVAALLAEVRYGAQRVGTSTDWKVSLTGPTGWETVAFDDGSWAGAKDYGTYGVAPWYKNVSGYPKDTPAHWIWTSNNDADNVIYVRFTFNYDGVAVLGAVPLLGEPKVGGTETGEVGSAATAPNEPLTLGKASVKLNFAKTEMDQIQLAGVLPVAEGFDPTGKTLTVNFGGIELTFTLNAKGQAAEDNNRCKLQLKRKKGVVAAQNAKFLIQLKSGDFALALGDEDLTNTDCRNVEVTIPVAITLGGTTYAADKKLSFSAKADKTGLAK